MKQLEKEASAAAETRLDALMKPRVTAFRQALRSNRGALYGNLTHSKVALARGVHSDDNIKEIKSKFVHFDDNGTLDSVLRSVLRKRAIGNSSETTADAWLGELLTKGRERPEYALYLKDCVEDSLIAIFPSLLSKSNLSNYVKEATLKEMVETLDRNWRAKP